MMKNLIKLVLFGIAGVLAFGLLIQLIPVNRTNPTVVTQVKWDSPQTQTLFKRACADCHSNETVWPWYSKVAPVSWLVVHDVDEGRSNLNVSDLASIDPTRLSRRIDEINNTITRGKMPKSIYLPMHPEAKLTQAEAQSLATGLQKSLLASINP
jgi:mono/diheme cytochrome c family protein